MCFSATASFTAAFILIIIGILTIGIKKNISYSLLATFPLLFGVQQFFEGLVWIGLNNNLQIFTSITAGIFIAFAVMVWPIILPLSLYFFEKDKARLFILRMFLGASTLWFAMVMYLWITRGASAEIVANHIIYYFGQPSNVLFPRIVYTVLTVGPFFVTRVKPLWVLAGLFTAAEVVSLVLYRSAFVSVWCFFAAIVSIYLYIFFKKLDGKH